MTTRPIVSVAGLEAMEAADAGVLTYGQRRGETYAHWRIEIDADIWKPVTRTGGSLLARGLIAKGDAFHDEHGNEHVRAVLTDTGRAILDDLHGRSPEPRPVPAAELPAGVTCILGTGAPLDTIELAAIADFQQFLTDRKAINDEYAPRLKAMSAGDPAYAALWNERARKLDELRVAYEAAHGATVIPPRTSESEA